MKKIEIAELILDWLSGGDAPADIKGRYHENVILKHMNNAYGVVLELVCQQAKRQMDYSVLDSWAREYTAGITDGVVTFPYPPMQLPDNRGILYIVPGTGTSKDLTNPFLYRETNAQGILSHLEVSTVLTNPTYYIEQNAASVDNVDTHQAVVENVPEGITSVTMKLIVPLEEVELYDEVSMPAGKEDILVKSVIAIMQGKPVEDVINDGLSR